MKFEAQNGYLPYTSVVKNMIFNAKTHEWSIKTSQMRLNTKLNRSTNETKHLRFNTLTNFNRETSPRDYDEKSITPSVFSNAWRRT